MWNSLFFILWEGGRGPISPLVARPTWWKRNKMPAEKSERRATFLHWIHFFWGFFKKKNDVLIFFLHFFASVQFIATSEKKCNILQSITMLLSLSMCIEHFFFCLVLLFRFPFFFIDAFCCPFIQSLSFSCLGWTFQKTWKSANYIQLSWPDWPNARGRFFLNILGGNLEMQASPPGGGVYSLIWVI